MYFFSKNGKGKKKLLNKLLVAHNIYLEHAVIKYYRLFPNSASVGGKNYSHSCTHKESQRKKKKKENPFKNGQKVRERSSLLAQLRVYKSLSCSPPSPYSHKYPLNTAGVQIIVMLLRFRNDSYVK